MCDVCVHLWSAELHALLSDIVHSMSTAAIRIVVSLRRAMHNRRQILVETATGRLDCVHQLKDSQL